MRHPELHRGTPEEFEHLIEVEASADVRFAAFGFGGLTPGTTVEGLANALGVLVVGRPAVGFCHVVDLDHRAHLEGLYVQLHHGGQGIGTALLEGAKELARHAGYTAMTLSTFADVPFNAPFYLRRGFQVLEEAAVGPGLLAVREAEARNGITTLGPRVQLWCDLD